MTHQFIQPVLKNDKLPPVSIKMTMNRRNIFSQINEITSNLPTKRIIKDPIKLYLKPLDDYRAIQKFLLDSSHSSIEIFELPLRSEIPRKIVIKGLPRDMLISEINLELSNMDFSVHTVAQ